MDITIEQAMAFLKEQGYCVDNLWHIDDVKANFECTDDEAHRILSEVLRSEWHISDTFEMINDSANLSGLIEKL